MMEMPKLKRTWIDINLDTLLDNYREACRLTDAKVTCVIKSNAYGHGAVTVAKVLQQNGCDSYAVSCARQALELRFNGISGEILIMGLTETEMLPMCIHHNIVITVGNESGYQAVMEAAHKLQTTAHIQIKLDTGFHRLGFDCTDEMCDVIAGLSKSSNSVVIDGIYSHLGLISRQRDILQHTRLVEMMNNLKKRGVVIPDIHICDSIGLVRYPEFHHSRVRVGAFLYGVRPYKSQHMNFRCGQTLTFRTTVAQVRKVKKGEIIGYSDDQILDHDAVIATLCAGYGDGYPRHLSNGKGIVSIRGHRVPVFGLICMDQMMVDVTGFPDIMEGDTVDLLGGGIAYQEYADMCKTNRNEAITILSRRPVRFYYYNHKEYNVEDRLNGGKLV